MTVRTTPKHARRIDKKRRLILPAEFPPGETVVLQPMEKQVWIVSILKVEPRHFKEASAADGDYAI